MVVLIEWEDSEFGHQVWPGPLTGQKEGSHLSISEHAFNDPCS